MTCDLQSEITISPLMQQTACGRTADWQPAKDKGGEMRIRDSGVPSHASGGHIRSIRSSSTDDLRRSVPGRIERAAAQRDGRHSHPKRGLLRGKHQFVEDP
jgi:hypothetical protein